MFSELLSLFVGYMVMDGSIIVHNVSTRAACRSALALEEPLHFCNQIEKSARLSWAFGKYRRNLSSFIPHKRSRFSFKYLAFLMTWRGSLASDMFNTPEK